MASDIHDETGIGSDRTAAAHAEAMVSVSEVTVAVAGVHQR